MADGDTTTTQAKEPEAPRYDRDRLVRDSNALLGVNGPVVVGALESETAKTFTVAAAKKKIDAFLKREAEVDPHSAPPEDEE